MLSLCTVVTPGSLDNCCYGDHVSGDTRVYEVRGQLALDGAWNAAGLPLTVPSQFLDPGTDTVCGAVYVWTSVLPDGLPVNGLSVRGAPERSELSPSAFRFRARDWDRVLAIW